jgi:polyphosphate kinase 2 (PPK2 family)
MAEICWNFFKQTGLIDNKDSAPIFEEMLIRAGIFLVKYWFSVSDDEQEKRFQERIRSPIKRWKLSPMDIESRKHWVEYSKAKDEMFASTDTKLTPWYVVNADDKRKARLNCIAHLLKQVSYSDLTSSVLELPPRQSDTGYNVIAAFCSHDLLTACALSRIVY